VEDNLSHSIQSPIWKGIYYESMTHSLLQCGESGLAYIMIMEDNHDDRNVMEENDDNMETSLLLVYYFTFLLTFLYHKLFGFHLHVAVHCSIAAILRVRVSVLSIFRQLGAYYIPRANHMDALSFWRLHHLLRPYLGGKIHPSSINDWFGWCCSLVLCGLQPLQHCWMTVLVMCLSRLHSNICIHSRLGNSFYIASSSKNED
jgi:uncharacterized membrane protein (DUF485 family)